MDKAKFVEIVKKHCEARGISLSAACRESGAGESLMDNVKRGRTPSIDSIQKLAAYFGVTTSQLLGEGPPAARRHELSSSEYEFVEAYRAADDRARDMVALALEPWIKRKKKDRAI